MAKGFAYINPEGDIDIRSVSTTQRAVMVNMIAFLSNGLIFPTQGWSDEFIERIFSAIREKNSGIAVIDISIDT